MVDEGNRRALLRQRGADRRIGRTGRAIAAVHHDRHRPQRGDIEQRQNPRRIGCACLGRHVLDLARFGGGREGTGLGNPAHLGQLGRRVERPRPFAHQFHSVILDRIVRGGHRDPATSTEIRRGSVDFFGAAQAAIECVRARLVYALAQRRRQLRRALPRVVTDRDRGRAQHLDKGPADPPGDVRIDGLVEDAAQIIGFKTVQLPVTVTDFRTGRRHSVFLYNVAD